MYGPHPVRNKTIVTVVNAVDSSGEGPVRVSTDGKDLPRGEERS